MDSVDIVALRDMLRTLDGQGLQGSVRWMLPAGLALILGQWSSVGGRQQTLWVDTPTESDAQALTSDLRALLPGAVVANFPGMAPYAGGESSPAGIVLKDRLSALIGLLEHRVQVLVTGPLAGLEKLPHPSWFEKSRLILARGAELPRELLLETLVELGYKRVELSGQPGEFSARGLVIDLWPDQYDNPLRLECYGDELERISHFDPDTQRRTGDAIESVSLYPRFEAQRTTEALLTAIESRSHLTIEPDDDTAFRRARLASQGSFPGEELFYPLLSHPKGQLLHWVPPCFRVRLEPSWEVAIVDKERLRINEGIARLRRGGVVCANFEDRFEESDRSKATLHLTEWQSESSTSLQAQPVRDFQGRLGELGEYLQHMVLTGHRVFLAGSTAGMRDRFKEIIRDYELPLSNGTEIGCRPLQLNLTSGAYLKEPKLIVLTEREVFGRRAIPPTKPQKSRVSAFLSDLRDLKSGDCVVHLDHGIGEFLGFGTLEVGGEEQDVIQLRYADGGRLNVALERADLVQRYVSPDNTKPPLDKLGGISWAKVKRRAKKAIRDMAEELLKLYAKRKMEKGYAFSMDGPEMAEFEAGFPYEPTPDQLEASEAIKADLESQKPMDRLVCGDVGFGKTEVAMRAAAKVALDGKQVAILCPTTVLCFQHYRTFQERFAGFPLRIEMLNRFVESSVTKKIQQDIADGKVEIVIGTHQLLGARIQFADLGLVVIDEEQRFGVGHKEKLKKLRTNVDVLAMSATPIPRTLHMSLTGLREISLIETPPKNRLAIETVVAPWSDELVASAIQFEMRRNGQVYVIHNRVESIISIAERLLDLVPSARVGVGHAQLSDEALEQVMLSFMEGRLDVLVATTIVENGLDVPNANTLIVHRADSFGLSQLYQLRGRVGRSDVPAYAYLLIPGKGDITEDARKRLQALEDFSELGSGFRIAALDLELRGAGNLLGGEQSGHIHEIGFELYVKLLEETLQEIKGEPSGTFEVKLNLGTVKISKRWLDQSSERVVAYKRLSRIRTERELELYRLELEDRFGPVPNNDDDTEQFFQIMKVKIQAQRLAVSEVGYSQGKFKFKLSPQTPIDPAKLMAWVQHHKNYNFSPDGSVSIPANSDSPASFAESILKEWEAGLV
ncbi:MAG: transcription-repair coupling factor [Holophagaceae bacterium]|nr:transcription-repair coupling factor [Holophagaceae bacterium]